MKKYIDLHVHSTISDGTFTPSELVHYALKKNLAAFALTDHDTTDGLEEAFSAALGSNLEIIPGIELSTTWNSTDVHIVGLDIDWKNTHFQKTLSEFQISRNLRNEKDDCPPSKRRNSYNNKTHGGRFPRQRLDSCPFCPFSF